MIALLTENYMVEIISQKLVTRIITGHSSLEHSSSKLHFLTADIQNRCSDIQTLDE